MYKRALRLTLCCDDDALCQQALVFAASQSQWLVLRTQNHQTPLDHWADLIISIGHDEAEFSPPLAGHQQLRHWQAPVQASQLWLERQLDGVVGGLRLLSRLDDEKK